MSTNNRHLFICLETNCAHMKPVSCCRDRGLLHLDDQELVIMKACSSRQDMCGLLQKSVPLLNLHVNQAENLIGFKKGNKGI